jgi:hypothetical protein
MNSIKFWLGEVSISIIKSHTVGFISYEMTENINFTRLHKHKINPAQNNPCKQASYQERNVDSVKGYCSIILINFGNQNK